jgi:hypothetical protein
VSALSAPAHAHEPPHGIGLVWSDPAADAAPIILSNYGLIFTNDSGASRFSIRCNQSYGALSATRPKIMLDGQNAIVIATTLDIHRTSDDACTFAEASGLPIYDYDKDAGPPDLTLGGFAIDPSKPGRALASTQAYTTPAQLFVSEDYARTWKPLSTNVALTVYDQLLIAEDGLHLLASGKRYDQTKKKTLSLYAYSSDGGKTWTDTDLEATREPLGFLPSDSNVVFMREAVPSQGVDPRDKLLRSSDGGKTFAVIGEPLPSLAAFTATPDGNTVWVSARYGGLFQSNDSGLTFTRVLPELITGSDCLYYRQGVLWACANIMPNTDGIFVSKDLGASFQEHMRFGEVTTQVECADVEVCERAWADWTYDLEHGWSSPDGGPAPSQDAGVSRDASTPVADAGTEEPLDAGHDAGPALAKDDGGCALGGRTDAGLFALALAALFRRRRKTLG